MALRTADKPLYRKVNTRARGVGHRSGGDFRHERNTKAAQDDRAWRPMSGRGDRGLDYTPLFRFLLASVGRDWDAVYAEAVARLDRPEPIFWLVARPGSARAACVRVGESSYFSGLFVDERNVLRRVDPELRVEALRPACGCCTHTFNGVRFPQKW